MKVLLFLLASLGFGAMFGRYTSKPLWWAVVYPAVAVVLFFFLILARNEQPHRWVEGFKIVGPFIIGTGVLCGALSYFSAQLIRGPGIKISAMNLKASLLARKKTMYLVILLMVVSIGIELWRKYFA